MVGEVMKSGCQQAKRRISFQDHSSAAELKEEIEPQTRSRTRKLPNGRAKSQMKKNLPERALGISTMKFEDGSESKPQPSIREEQTGSRMSTRSTNTSERSSKGVQKVAYSERTGKEKDVGSSAAVFRTMSLPDAISRHETSEAYALLKLLKRTIRLVDRSHLLKWQNLG